MLAELVPLLRRYQELDLDADLDAISVPSQERTRPAARTKAASMTAS